MPAQGSGQALRPRPQGRLLERHGNGERCLGEPVCGDCFDYQAQVLWNALAPELWRRTTVYAKRALAQLAGISRRGLDRAERAGRQDGPRAADGLPVDPQRILEASKANRRIPTNPVRLVPVPPPRVDPDAILGHVRRRAFTPEEFGRLLAGTSQFYWDHFITQVGTGLRSGELLGLQPSRVLLDLQPSRVLLDQARLEVVDVRYDAGKFGTGYRNRPKTVASIRAVPLAPIVVKAATRKLDGCPSDGRVFCGPGGSHGVPRGVRSRLSTGNYRRAYQHAAELAAFTGWTCTARTTCARPTPPCWRLAASRPGSSMS